MQLFTSAQLRRPILLLNSRLFNPPCPLFLLPKPPALPRFRPRFLLQNPRLFALRLIRFHRVPFLLTGKSPRREVLIQAIPLFPSGLSLSLSGPAATSALSFDSIPDLKALPDCKPVLRSYASVWPAQHKQNKPTTGDIIEGMAKGFKARIKGTPKLKKAKSRMILE